MCENTHAHYEVQCDIKCDYEVQFQFVWIFSNENVLDRNNIVYYSCCLYTTFR